MLASRPSQLVARPLDEPVEVLVDVVHPPAVVDREPGHDIDVPDLLDVVHVHRSPLQSKANVLQDVMKKKIYLQGGPSARIAGLTLILAVSPSAWFCLG